MSKKPPLIMKFQIMANKGTYKGEVHNQILVHYDSFTELIAGMKKLYREGYCEMFITVKGIYGRKAIPWAELNNL